MQEVKGNKKNSKTWLIRIAVVLVILLAMDLILFAGNIRYYAKWVSCGTQPVYVQSLPGKAWYENTNPYPELLKAAKWYCTPIEAERAGYSASESQRIFPNLDKAGESWPEP